MKKFVFVVFLFVVFIPLCLFSYNNYLRFVNPQNSYGYNNLKFHSIKSIVVPQGIYTSYEIEFEISSANSLGPTTQLELQWFFQLPVNAFLNNAWLWVGDTLVEADVLDRWTASMIYEGIVNRRKDPLLVMKTGNSYDLKLYPFIGDQPRKFKLKFMMPNNLNGTAVQSDFDLNGILPASGSFSYPRSVIKVLGNNLLNEPVPVVANEFGTPQIITEGENNDIKYYEFTQNTAKRISNFGVGYKINQKNNLMFAYSKSTPLDGYYQISVPKDIIQDENSQEYLFLINYNVSKTSLQKSKVIDIVKNYITLNLNSKDKFNVLFGDYKIKPLSENWITSNDNIDSLFANKDINLSDYSVLSSLVFEGLQFIKDKGTSSSIVLINCSDEFYSPQTANSFLEDIFKDLKAGVPFNIIDYQSLYFNNYQKNNIYYYGNEYFNSILTKNTGGSNFNYKLTGGDIPLFIEKSLGELNYGFDNLEVRVKPANGLTYLTYEMGSSIKAGSYVYDIQYGRFTGEFPFDIEVVGLKDGKVHFYNYTVQESDALNFKESSKVWIGKYLRDLEATTNQNDNKRVKEIIDISMRERILTNYTAFLALEPWMKKSDTINTENPEDPDVTSVENDNIIQTESISVYPNPFAEYIQIDFEKLSASEIVDKISIIDLSGNTVFNLSDFKDRKSIKCDLSDIELPDGVYILLVETSLNKYRIKIVKIGK